MAAKSGAKWRVCKKCCMPAGAAEMAVKLMASPNEIKHFGNMFALLTRSGNGIPQYCGSRPSNEAPAQALHLSGRRT